nr:MAG TPA: hypothetical protein [Bacteriophage sp.]DAN39183.1 MAG TPA: hypothetical protein [Caudoviricetes sp.]
MLVSRRGAVNTVLTLLLVYDTQCIYSLLHRW